MFHSSCPMILCFYKYGYSYAFSDSYEEGKKYEIIDNEAFGFKHLKPVILIKDPYVILRRQEPAMETLMHFSVNETLSPCSNFLCLQQHIYCNCRTKRTENLAGYFFPCTSLLIYVFELSRVVKCSIPTNSQRVDFALKRSPLTLRDWNTPLLEPYFEQMDGLTNTQPGKPSTQWFY